MSTALATVSSMNDAPLVSEFPLRANVVPRDLVKSREFFIAFPQKFNSFRWNVCCTTRSWRNYHDDDSPRNA